MEEYKSDEFNIFVMEYITRHCNAVSMNTDSSTL